MAAETRVATRTGEAKDPLVRFLPRSEEHTSELQSRALHDALPILGRCLAYWWRLARRWRKGLRWWSWSSPAAPVDTSQSLAYVTSLSKNCLEWRPRPGLQPAPVRRRTH